MIVDRYSMLKNHDKLSLCLPYLNYLYNHPHFPRNANKPTNINYARGEILPQSVDKLIKLMMLTRDDIFLDLGSEAGKLVIQVFLQTEVKCAFGIEIVPSYYEQSRRAAALLEAELPIFFHDQRKLFFLQADFLQINWDATVIFINNICFTQNIIALLGERINANPLIRMVLTLRPMSNLQRFKFKKAVSIEGSWDSALCYLYEVKG